MLPILTYKTLNFSILFLPLSNTNFNLKHAFYLLLCTFLYIHVLLKSEIPSGFVNHLSDSYKSLSHILIFNSKCVFALNYTKNVG